MLSPEKIVSNWVLSISKRICSRTSLAKLILCLISCTKKNIFLHFIEFTVFQFVPISSSLVTEDHCKDCIYHLSFQPLDIYKPWYCWSFWPLIIDQSIICEQVIFSHALHIHYIPKFIIPSTHSDCPTDIAL